MDLREVDYAVGEEREVSAAVFRPVFSTVLRCFIVL